MPKTRADPEKVHLLIVAQAGRLQYEAVIFAASLAATTPPGRFRLFVAEPRPGPLWTGDPRIADPETRALLEDLGATFLPFDSRHFGETYPYGNKIEALLALPRDTPFLFFDSDTLVTGDLGEVPLDYARPAASLRREGTWPRIAPGGPGYTRIWRALYDRFGLDYESSLDLDQPDEYWQRYLYFNAGFFYYRCPHVFGQRFLDHALSIRDDPLPELAGQSLDPWLDQIALPLVIHGLGGGRDALEPGWLDGRTTCHYRTLPLLYARESDRVVEVLEEVGAAERVKEVLRQYTPIRQMLYQRRGHEVRGMFDRKNLPAREQVLRRKLKEAGLWMR